MLSPLYHLLKQGVKWQWNKQHTTAFAKAKRALQDDSLLVHYNSTRQLVLACDASPYGLGAVLSHIMDDGQERPVAYASRTLTPAEKNYSQLEKEALGVVFAVQKFHKYLYGRHFIIESDHRPLSFIFSNSKYNITNSFIQNYSVDPDIKCILLHHPSQTWQRSWKCRCTKSFTPTSDHQL